MLRWVLDDNSESQFNVLVLFDFLFAIILNAHIWLVVINFWHFGIDEIDGDDLFDFARLKDYGLV